MQGDFEVEKLSAEEREQLIGPRALFSIHKAFNAVGNPRRVLMMIRETIGELIKQLEDLVRRKKILEVQLDGEGVAAKDKSEEALSGIKVGLFFMFGITIYFAFNIVCVCFNNCF